MALARQKCQLRSRRPRVPGAQGDTGKILFSPWTGMKEKALRVRGLCFLRPISKPGGLQDLVLWRITWRHSKRAPHWPWEGTICPAQGSCTANPPPSLHSSPSPPPRSCLAEHEPFCLQPRKKSTKRTSLGTNKGTSLGFYPKKGKGKKKIRKG